MNRIAFVFVVGLAFAVVDSLICNKCSVSVFGFCLNSSNETCTGNDTVCYTGKANFPSISSFNGFTNQGCRVNDASCNKTTSATLLGVTYNTTISCCSSDRCNPVTLSGAPTTKMTFTAAITGAVLASFLGSML
ncbi:sperm acrosome membrane-associated protein 4-like isoform X2 [Xiphophorus couchianus]|uniref:sperm acrosome membrane-associated protein 4-like isoform X2 n=1 Tax=Xiphophorus couchianus TaxID=32473 RepID=UPI001016353F|nr:sperm acrosome membrane-associated protein 4-like isoform X2 [Xiphophorus couchianus]XP_032437742.1 sperm acrosome membrane-associated protein 4-like isoform X2 [Xiphophorus hellerii]